jgi:chemotaxis signal transduction protein
VLRGMANLAGEIELVVSLEALLGIEHEVVLCTHRHEESEIEPVPSTLEKALLRYVHGTLEVEGLRVGVLDLNLVVYSVEQSLK